jgi:hypothetical protein
MVTGCLSRVPTDSIILLFNLSVISLCEVKKMKRYPEFECKSKTTEIIIYGLSEVGMW